MQRLSKSNFKVSPQAREKVKKTLVVTSLFLPPVRSIDTPGFPLRNTSRMACWLGTRTDFFYITHSSKASQNLILQCTL